MDRASLLETEARVIAEDETHAVIALRVEKRWIDRNMPFFSAIAEISTPKRKSRRKTDA
jgi:hypothetical protein